MADLQTFQAMLGFATALRDALDSPEKITAAGEALAQAVALSDAEIAKRDEYNLLLQETNEKLAEIKLAEEALAGVNTKLTADKAALAKEQAQYSIDSANLQNQEEAAAKLQDNLAAFADKLSDSADINGRKEQLLNYREADLDAREKALTKREEKLASTLAAINAPAEG